MVSEDVEKILALVIVALTFLSLPLLLFVFFVVLYIDVIYAIQFYQTRNFSDAFIVAGLTIAVACLFLGIWILAKWIRKR